MRTFTHAACDQAPMTPKSRAMLRVKSGTVKATPVQKAHWSLPPAHSPVVLQESCGVLAQSELGSLPLLAQRHPPVPSQTWQSWVQSSLVASPESTKPQEIPEPPVWQVLDGTGRWLGAVRMPERFRPHAVGSDWIAGVTRDAFDVERVEVRTLDRSGR